MKVYDRSLVSICIEKYIQANKYSQMYRSLLILRSYGVGVDTGLETYVSSLSSPDSHKRMNGGIDTLLSRKHYIDGIFKGRVIRQVSTEVLRMIRVSEKTKKYHTLEENGYY